MASKTSIYGNNKSKNYAAGDSMRGRLNKENNKMLLPYYQKLTLAEKFKDDAKWISDSVEYIDRYSGYTNTEYYNKLYINYSIAKGRGGQAIREVMNNQSGSKTISKADKALTNYKHYDILSPIYKAAAGEVQKRELHAIAKDISGYNMNLLKEKKEGYYQKWTQQNILDPIRQEATQSVFLDNGIINPQDLDPEQQKQIQADIEKKVQFSTPEDIEHFMSDKYKSPSETMIQEMLDWYVKHFDIKFKTDESFKHLYLSGREIAYQTIENMRPVCKILNPKGFNYFSKDNTFFIDEAEWWSYEEYITYIDLVSGLPGDSKVLEEMHRIAGKYGLTSTDYARREMRGELPRHANDVVATINTASSGAFLDNAPDDLGSPDGQQFLNYIYNTFGNRNIGENLLRKTNICYTSFDLVYLVERYDSKKDKMDFFWVGENYTPDPELDRSVTPQWAPAYYQADKIGEESYFIYNKKRCEFQNRSVNDPFDITPPYTGVEYSRLFNNAEPVAPLDFGKPLNYEYNVVKDKLEEADKRDIGKVFAIPESFIPKEWSMEQFVAFIKENGFVPINENNSSLNPAISAQILKSIDVTTADYIPSYINRLQSIKREAEEAMSYSPSSLGEAAPSLTATSNQQNIIQSSYKTEDIYGLHTMFINRLLQNGMTMMKNAILSNEPLKQAILSIPSLAALEVDDELLFESLPFIKILNTSNEVKGVEDVKSLIQPMIQNGVISNISEVIKLHFKKNSAELINVAEEAERKNEEARQKEIQRQQEEAQKDRDLQMKLAESASKEDRYRFDEEIKMKKYVADKEHDQWLRQTDADQNAVPDSVQSTKLKVGLDEKKIEASKEIAEMNNKSKEKIASLKPNPATK